MTSETDKSATYTEPGVAGLVSDWAADRQTFDMPWGKIMMWIFLLSDTFIFSVFLTSYMNVRISATDPWPNASEVFALQMFGEYVPLLLIAIMTFILITSSGTMAMAVNYAYRGDIKKNGLAYRCHRTFRCVFRRNAGFRME